MNRYSHLLSLLLAVALSQTAAHAQPGVIQGIIRDSDRKLLPNVAVVVTPDRSQRGQVIPFQGWAITKSDGSYLIRNVPPGQYVVCPQVPQSDVLNPCQWSAVAPTVRVTATGPQSSVTQNVTLDRGTFIYFQVEDPSGHLDANEGKPAANGLRLGVRSPQGEYSPAAPPMRGAKRRLYRALVPKAGQYIPVLEAPGYQIQHGPFGAAPGANPFGQLAESRVGDPQKVFVLNILSVVSVPPGKL